MSKNAIITGASRGIGKAIAISLINKGYNTCLICKTQESLASLKELKKYAEDNSKKCIIYAADLSREDSFAPILEEAEAFLGPTDLLINNAGVASVGLFTDLTNEEWHRVLSNNLDSVFYCSRAVLKKMINRHEGKIINISSVWGNVGASCEVAYSASKGAVNALTKALAKEVGPSGISVNAIALGMIDTQMNNCYSEEEKQMIVDEIPVCRMGVPSEVGEFVAGIVESSNYLTGQIITFDGGWT